MKLQAKHGFPQSMALLSSGKSTSLPWPPLQTLWNAALSSFHPCQLDLMHFVVTQGFVGSLELQLYIFDFTGSVDGMLMPAACIDALSYAMIPLAWFGGPC